VAAEWLYGVVRPVLAPPRTTPYGLFVLALVHAAAAVLQAGGDAYSRAVYDMLGRRNCAACRAQA
jgi:hypothetical protein